MSQEGASDGLRMTQVLTALTGVAALFVGLLYSVGAVLIAGQLKATGVAMRDVLPLVPLPQMLGRGMSALLGSFGLLLFLAIATAPIFLAGRWLERARLELTDELAGMHATLDELR